MPKEFSAAPVIVADGKYRPSENPRAVFTDAQAADFENKVVAALDDLAGSSTVANVLFGEINSVGQRKSAAKNAKDKTWVRIAVPYVGMKFSAETKVEGRMEAANPDDDVIYQGLDDDETTKDDKQKSQDAKRKKVWISGDHPMWKRGGGSAVTIFFSPDSEDAAKALVHEMTHALRDMSGIVNPIPTELPLYDFQNEEEFFAMLVANIYLSEMNRNWDLRASHVVFKRLEGKHATSEGFLANDDFGKAARKLVAKLKKQMPGFFEALATVPPQWLAFNPIHEYHDNP